jgi:hypothetical protein
MKYSIKNVCLIFWCILFFALLAINTYVYFNRKSTLPVPVENENNVNQEKKAIENIAKKKEQFTEPVPAKLIEKKIAQPNAEAKPPSPKIPEKKPETVSKKPVVPPKSNLLIEAPQSWDSFLSIPFDRNYIKYDNPLQRQQEISMKKYKPNLCPATTVEKLAAPRLTDSDFNWCRWALSPTGANVVVGKSWGKLSSKSDKEKFDALNCNSVANGKNPSCDDSWGDVHIKNWINDHFPNFDCAAGRSSKVECHRNDNSDLSCEMFNVQIDFRKVKKVSRGSNTPSKIFQQDFLSTDCKPDVRSYPDFPFPHLYSPKLASDKCDIVYNGTVLMYSHDDIRNLGHTLNDVMNIWIMLWMAKLGRYSNNIEMLNIDSFKLGHNFDDKPNAFFLTYQKALKNILKGIDYQNKVVCFKHVLLQPIPPRFFIWESWFIDLPCSFIGPSTLYQRWNLNVRAAYGLLDNPRSSFENNENKKLKVLMIVRNEHSNMWGSQRTSRNYLNLPEITSGLKSYESSHAAENVEFVIEDLSKYTFEEQLKLISDVSIMVGMHGAGVASSMHMSVGSKYCCGVLEIYPQGEFSPIKGHGNMARKMGIHYDRMDLSAQNSLSNGATVPVSQLISKIDSMIKRVREQPSCVHPDVMKNPYLEI